MFLYCVTGISAALKEILGAKKYSDITVNLFSKNSKGMTEFSWLWWMCRYSDREQQAQQSCRCDQGIPDHHECLQRRGALCGHYSQGESYSRAIPQSHPATRFSLQPLDSKNRKELESVLQKFLEKDQVLKLELKVGYNCGIAQNYVCVRVHVAGSITYWRDGGRPRGQVH